MVNDTTTWRKQFDQARKDWSDQSVVVAIAPNDAALDVVFDPGWGGSEGPPVLIWTEERVYFPVVYDGSEWLESAPRNPVSEGQAHVGGQ